MIPCPGSISTQIRQAETVCGCAEVEEEEEKKRWGDVRRRALAVLRNGADASDDLLRLMRPKARQMTNLDVKKHWECDLDVPNGCNAEQKREEAIQNN
jgi:hypothetical protein